MERRCHFCGGLIGRNLRPQALYCSQSCKVRSRRHYKELEKLPEELRVFQLWVAKHAPAEAVSYRVGIDLTPRRFVYFPRSDAPSPRWDGTQSRRPYFRLCPFEPPVVPKVGKYGFQFFDQEGNELETPVRLIQGLRLVPLLKVKLRGDQWKPEGEWYTAPSHRNGPRVPRLMRLK